MVPESLGPLEELEVVLHLAFGERLDRDGLVDVVLGEGVCMERNQVSILEPILYYTIDIDHGNSLGHEVEDYCRQGRSEELTLQDLEVLDVCIFALDVELDTRHGHIEEDAVKDLTESGTIDGRYKVSSDLAVVCLICLCCCNRNTRKRRGRVVGIAMGGCELPLRDGFITRWFGLFGGGGVKRGL